MAEHEGLERVVRIEKKLDALSISVDERFNEVRDHFVEQREYIEFAYDRLDRRISDGLARLEQRVSEGFAASDQRMDMFDQRMDTFDQRMDRFDQRMDRFDQRMDMFDQRMDTLDQRMDSLDQRMAHGFAAADQRTIDLKHELTEGFSRVERKLDQFIESQSRSKVTRRARPSKRRR
jgi:hypothetical protein